jgi:hypothetical protein
VIRLLRNAIPLTEYRVLRVKEVKGANGRAHLRRLRQVSTQRGIQG